MTTATVEDVVKFYNNNETNNGPNSVTSVGIQRFTEQQVMISAVRTESGDTGVGHIDCPINVPDTELNDFWTLATIRALEDLSTKAECMQ